MTRAKLVPLTSYREYPPEQMKERAIAFRAEMQRRRSVRTFASRPVAREVIEECLLTAGSAPSGANMQPWSFVVVSASAVKRQIRQAAEKEVEGIDSFRLAPIDLWIIARAGNLIKRYYN